MYLHAYGKIFEWLYPRRRWRGDTDAVYLTFDDGPIPEVTPWVMDTLAKYGIKGTFFCVGDNVRKYPEVFKRLISEGHHVGNHTFNHLNGQKVENRTYLENVKKCSDEIERQGVTSKLFRPPHGKLKYSQTTAMGREYEIVMWNVLSGDFDQKLSKEDCLAATLKATRRGSVVVFHDSIKTLEKLEYVLPRYIESCLDRGMKFDVLG